MLLWATTKCFPSLPSATRFNLFNWFHYFHQFDMFTSFTSFTISHMLERTNDNQPPHAKYVTSNFVKISLLSLSQFPGFPTGEGVSYLSGQQSWLITVTSVCVHCTCSPDSSLPSDHTCLYITHLSSLTGNFVSCDSISITYPGQSVRGRCQKSEQYSFLWVGGSAKRPFLGFGGLGVWVGG